MRKKYPNLHKYPPPASLIFCRMFKYQTRGKGYICGVCGGHIPCVRYLEAELWSKGIEVTRSSFGDEEEKEQMEEYLRAIGYREEEG